MKHNKFEFMLYSALGVVLMFFILVAINFISSAVKFRKDMTEYKLFTLAEGTRNIVQNLEAPIEIRFYRSESGKNVPSSWKTYMRTVDDMLSEIEEISGGNVVVKKFDPQPDSDEADLASLDGIQGQLNPGTGESFYLGVAISQDPAKVALPVLPPNRAELLEYDLARAISRVTQTDKPVVGIMTPLPMFGQPANPMMARMGQQQGQRPWVVVSELQRDFDVRQITMDVSAIEDAIDVLIVVHPKEITDQAQYAIDQFVLRGGKLLALLDSKSIMDRPQDGNPMSAMMGGGASNLEKLLQSWGINFETTKVVADRKFTREVSFQRGAPPQKAPSLLFLNKEAVNQEDVATSQIDNMLLPMAGSFSGTPVDGLEQTILIHSSDESQLVDPMTAQFQGQKILDEFKASEKEYTLALRLQGKFKSAFPDGKPKAAPEDGEQPDASPAETGLKEATEESVVILFGDSDFIYDNFSVEVIPLFNVVQPINGNLTLVQNLVEQMGGDINLIGARSRANINRPFTEVQKMEVEANKRFQDEIKKLEDEKAEAEKRLGELQAQKDPNQQQFILTKEQQDEIARFREKQVQANKQLKQVRKNLRKEIDSLEFWTKVYNIAGMPLIVIIAGLSIAIIRKQRTRAR